MKDTLWIKYKNILAKIIGTIVIAETVLLYYPHQTEKNMKNFLKLTVFQNKHDQRKMFSIVSMQEVLINLNGGDDLFRLFEGPRSKKRSVSKLVKEKPPLFTVQQVWILPCHILILTQNSQKLLAFDQVPGLSIHDKEETDLLSPLEDCCGGVLDIVRILEDKEFILLLLRNGDLLVWAFSKPSYEWSVVTRASLTNCRTTQMISYIFDDEEKMFVWCEKRSSSYCHVFSARVDLLKDKSVNLSDPQILLHNSLPMHIYRLPDGCCFIPVANKPPGLLLFSSNKTNVITVHMWSDGFDKRYIPTTCTDFQQIITSCISLWIHSSICENKFIAIATHPSTKQLVVLQNDLQVYLVGGHCTNECRDVVYLCTLEVEEKEKELFAKQVSKLFPYQRLLVLVMSDGLINIFDTRGGFFLWKTETFRNNVPQIWIRRGSLPTIGVWNRSGIWNLRPNAVSEQIKSFYQVQSAKDDCIENKNKTILGDIEMKVDAIDGQIKNVKQRRRIKQGVNRSAEIPKRYIFQILDQWKLSNLSTDLALTIAMHIKGHLKDEESEEEVHMEELISIIDEIKDPVLLVVLLSDKELPYTIRKRVLVKLGSILETDASKYIGDDILAILKEYYELGKQIDDCYFNKKIVKRSSTEEIIERELVELEESTTNVEYNNCKNVDRILVNLVTLDEKYFMEVFLAALLPNDLLEGTYFESKKRFAVTDDLKILFWKALLRFESEIFERTCLQVWTHAPLLLPLLIKEAEKKILSVAHDNTAMFSSMDHLILSIMNLIWLPDKPKHDTTSTIDKSDIELRIRTYCDYLQVSNVADKDEVAYTILLDHLLIDDAFKILEKQHGKLTTKHHFSLFFQMVCVLLRNKCIEPHIERLTKIIPDKFNIASFYNVFTTQAVGISTTQLFKSDNGKDMSIGMLRPLLAEMLKE